MSVFSTMSLNTRNIVFKRTNGSKYIYSTSDIEHLFTTTSVKCQNGSISAERENIFKAMLTHRKYFDNRSQFITDMVTNLMDVLKDFKGYKIRHMGGRKSDYDFRLYLADQEWFKLEYKFSCHEHHSSIFDQPQLTSLSTESNQCVLFMKADQTYLEYVYGSVFHELCTYYGIDIPPLKDYIDITKSTKAKKDIQSDWFSELTAVSKENKKVFDALFKQSISEYIGMVDIDLCAMTEWFKERHRNKIILCQYKEMFNIEICNDIFNIDNLKLLSVDQHPENNNKLIVRTNANFDLQLYVRWKNTTGLQNPALDFKPIYKL